VRSRPGERVSGGAASAQRLDLETGAFDNSIVDPLSRETLAFRCARALIARERQARRIADQAAQDTRAALERCLRGLRPEDRPQRIVLFGSLVWGRFDPERSDVDLLVWGVDHEQAAVLTDRLWQAVGRPVHLVRAENAPASLTERVEREGVALDVA